MTIILRYNEQKTPNGELLKHNKPTPETKPKAREHINFKAKANLRTWSKRRNESSKT